MALLQALFSLITKSAGKILTSVFGWAVRALFGRASPRETTFLSAVVGAAAAWPLLLVGLIAPKISALLLAFVPIPKFVPSWIVRLVWLGLALLVPLAVGIAVAAKAPPDRPRHSWLRRVLSGFPITIGLAGAFIIMFVTVPFTKLAAILRGQVSADIPLVTESSEYHRVATLSVEVLNRHGFALRPGKANWWMSAPLRVLQFFGGDAFGSFVPRQLEHHQAPNIDVAFYPSGVLLRGRSHKVTWAHGLICEATAQGQGFQTSSPAAQDLEKQIKRVWRVYSEAPEPHLDSARLLGRLAEIARDLGTVELEFDDWQVIYRQLLQAERALHGRRQVLEAQVKNEASGDTVGMKVPELQRAQAAASSEPAKAARDLHELSTAALVKEIGAEVAHLAKKQIELAMTEVKADLKKEAGTVAGLSVATIFGLATLNLLFVTAALALASFMPAWAAGLAVSGFTLLTAVIVGLVAWGRRVVDPLARSRRTIREDIQWSKEKMA